MDGLISSGLRNVGKLWTRHREKITSRTWTMLLQQMSDSSLRDYGRLPMQPSLHVY